MTTLLLKTKLYIPPIRTDLVSRPRLIEQLNAGLNRRLTLISAPAGFGKTTLLSTWLRLLQSRQAVAPAPPLPSSPGPLPPGSPGPQHPGSPAPSLLRSPAQAAWLSLDETDNEPTRFLAYLIAALQRVEAQVGRGALGILRSPQPPPAEAVLTSLINEIAALPSRVVLVLDDYHVIEAPPIHNALAFLLEHLPPHMHLVIATRVDPPLPLARLRARGQLTEMRAVDLRFYPSEAAEFLNSAMGLNLSAEDVAALERRTEGWIAGLQLAAISMRGHEDVTSFIKSFTGSHRFVLAYLIEEVLEQQPEAVQNFLLQTAILDRLSGSLCDAVRFSTAVPGENGARSPTDLTNGQATLQALEHANLFILPLDEERRWYRYHQLFVDLLRQRLRQTRPGWVPELHRRASAWYEQNGLKDEAISHALRAEDFERAVRLIEENADTMWRRGEHARLARSLSGLPDELVFRRPHLCIFHAWYLSASGQRDAAERCLQAAEQALEPGLVPSVAQGPDNATKTSPSDGKHRLSDADRTKLRGRSAAIRAFMGSYRGDVSGIIRHANMALEFLPEEDTAWRCLTGIVLADAHGFTGDMNAAYRARLVALEACETAGHTYYVMLAYLKLAITLREQAQLQRTTQMCQQQMELANTRGISQGAVIGWSLAIQGEVLAELNDLEEGICYTRKGVQVAALGGDLAILGWTHLCLIRVLFSRGDLPGAKAIARKMQKTARERAVPLWIANRTSAWQARLWLEEGDLEAASRWVRRRGLSAADGARPQQEKGFFQLFDYIMLARILIAEGRLDEADGLLERLLEIAKADGRTSRVIEMLMLKALALRAGAGTEQALSTLERALALAEPEGFIRAFCDEGPPMARLLYEAAARGIMPDYVGRLLAAFGDTTKDQAQTVGAAAPSRVTRQSAPTLSEAEALIEPLSERELEVLQLVAEGLTNREIAARLFLSLNTVKVHTRNIYGKLNVHSRTQAVARSQQLGLL